MPNYLRTKFEGGCYFFTVVTYECTKLFHTELARRCLREAIEEKRSRRPFETMAFCLLFEHQRITNTQKKDFTGGCMISNKS